MYENGSSTFDQTLAIMAQIRAGDSDNAAIPIGYLESVQEPTGAWPSLIPPSGGPDVDSTAMAVMALALVPGATSATAIENADVWMVSQQQSDGGFLGASGDSVNSTALAVIALKLAGSTSWGLAASPHQLA
jgi:prenyltransferase beta subunit